MYIVQIYNMLKSTMQLMNKHKTWSTGDAIMHYSHDYFFLHYGISPKMIQYAKINYMQLMNKHKSCGLMVMPLCKFVIVMIVIFLHYGISPKHNINMISTGLLRFLKSMTKYTTSLEVNCLLSTDIKPEVWLRQLKQYINDMQ